MNGFMWEQPRALSSPTAARNCNESQRLPRRDPRYDGHNAIHLLVVTRGKKLAPTWFVPFIETYTSERLPWARTPALHSFSKFPAMEDFAALTSEFAKNAGP
jgi:hypothetical protein